MKADEHVSDFGIAARLGLLVEREEHNLSHFFQVLVCATLANVLQVGAKVNIIEDLTRQVFGEAELSKQAKRQNLLDGVAFRLIKFKNLNWNSFETNKRTNTCYVILREA